jgi:hypothetical protein
MGAFSKKTIKIENPGVWKEGEYVKVRTRQTVADQQAIVSAVAESVPNLKELSKEQIEQRMIVGSVLPSLQRMIVEWKLFDDDGQEVELTPENVAELDGDYADYIFSHMSDGIGSAMSEQEQEHFLASASEPTPVSS